MLKRTMKSFIFIFFTLTTFLGMGISRSPAQGVVIFGPQETKIEGSIKYSVLGRYTVHFNNFKGRIILDEKPQRVRSVYLEINAASLKSNHPWYDKLARSRRLLNAARYPKIIFKSDKILQDAGGYQVKGVLEMHGIRRRMIFPFKAEIIGQNSQWKLLDIKGSWNIDRKDFNIIWNKYLDHGGIVVSDVFTVNWGIRAYIK